MTSLPPYLHDVLPPLVTIAILLYNNRKQLLQQKELHAANEATRAAWEETTNKTLVDHGERLDDHAGKFDTLSERFVPREEMRGKIDAIQTSIGALSHWLQSLLPIMFARSFPGGYMPMPQIPGPPTIVSSEENR